MEADGYWILYAVAASSILILSKTDLPPPSTVQKLNVSCSVEAVEDLGAACRRGVKLRKEMPEYTTVNL